MTLGCAVSRKKNVRGIDLLPSDLLLLGPDILEGLEGKKESSTLSKATVDVIRNSDEYMQSVYSRRPDDELLLEYFGHVEEMGALFGVCKTFETTGEL